MFKGVKQQFNACTEHVTLLITLKTNLILFWFKKISLELRSFDVLWGKLNFFGDKSSHGLDKVVFECIGKTVDSMADHTNLSQYRFQTEPFPNQTRPYQNYIKLKVRSSRVWFSELRFGIGKMRFGERTEAKRNPCQFRQQWGSVVSIRESTLDIILWMSHNIIT